jgi:alginate O-acetyltransferase complex protein AlgI
MSFDSVIFLSCFLPALLVFYWLIPGQKAKNTILLIFSLLFYSFSGLSGLLLLAALSLCNYLLGLWLRKSPNKGALITGIALNVIFLAFFKYLNFLLTQVLGLPALEMSLAVPLGISFFTFKNISYLADTYKDPASTKGSFFALLLYVSFFPQIVTGPITRFWDFAPQLQNRSITLEGTASGLRRFIVGLAKKLILSGTLGSLVDTVFGLPVATLNAPLAWLGAVGYCLQLYFDFSGYIDMAIGLGWMFGFTADENFNRPYLARTIGGFWRRWHMSLSAWFRDYVYIPLGGNRKGAFRAGVNKCIVFLLCGIWHGANFTFLLWGIWHGVFSLLESTGVIPAKKLEKSKVLGHIYTLLVVCIGFVMFRAASVAQGITVLQAMFTGFSSSSAATVALRQLLTTENIAALAVSILLCLPVPEKWVASRLWKPAACIGCLVLLVLSILYLAAGGFAPSIYAGF